MSRFRKDESSGVEVVVVVSIKIASCMPLFIHLNLVYIAAL